MHKSIYVKRKRIGRPPTGEMPFVGVRLPAALTAKINAWAKANDIGNRSEAIRCLVTRGLKAGTKPR